MFVYSSSGHAVDHREGNNNPKNAVSPRNLRQNCPNVFSTAAQGKQLFLE